MNQRTTIIVIISIVVILIAGFAAVSSAALAYVAIKARPDTIFIQNEKTSTQYTSGILIASVEPDSPADQAGLVRGDILTEIDNQAVNSFSDLVLSLEGHQSGDQIEIKVLHGDEVRTLNATLDERNGQTILGVRPCDGPQERMPVLDLPISNGVIIEDVVPDSPADKAGLKTGEWIISIEGEELSHDVDLATVIDKFQPEDIINLEVSVAGEDTKVVQVTLGEHPDDPNKAYLGIYYLPGHGLRGSESGRIPFHFPVPLPNMPYELPDGDISGAIITEVLPNSPAEVTNLVRGDIITSIDDQEINNPRELTKTIQSRKPGDEVSITVYRPMEDEVIIIQANLGEHPELENTGYLGVKVAHFVKSFNPENQQHFDLIPNFKDMPYFKEFPFFDGHNSEPPNLDRQLPGREA
jgi:S1-C subfamily serine protease